MTTLVAAAVAQLHCGRLRSARRVIGSWIAASGVLLPGRSLIT
jgi:hypothetical protein